MFTNFAASLSVFAALASYTLAPVAALPSASHHNVHRNVPSQYQSRDYAKDSEYLEPYTIYHHRYMDFGCENKHDDKVFFATCCHPLLKNQTVADLSDLCYEPCETETVSSHIATSTVSVKPTTSHHAAPTTTHHVAPPTTKHTSTHHTTTTAAKKPAASPSSSDDGGSGTWNTGGHATYFLQEGNAGACGIKHPDSALIVAIDIERYGYNTGVVSPLCGQKVEIVDLDNGNSVVATIADVCPTCTGNPAKNSIDLSVGTFTALEKDLSVGQFNIKWQFVN